MALSVSSSVNSTAESKCQCHHTSINPGNFPRGFIFGAASSAYQCEGAFNVNAKGLSMWDNFTHMYPDKILDHSNGDIAVDSYHRYKEDVKIARFLGLDAYRFSISWPRILPGIEPFVTILHFDVPQALQDAYGGFLSAQIVFMEPLTRGTYPESMRVRVRDRLPKFTEEEISMTKGSFDFIGFNYYGAMYAFNKPTSSFSYTTDSEIDITGRKNGKPIGEQARNSSRIYIYPQGLGKILRHIKEKYNDPLIYITENGLDESTNDTLGISYALKDDMRKDYIHDHICCLHEAMEKDGANVKGYFVWSLMDNFEWASGFSVRFGLNYVDFKDKTLRRYPKHSALWFKNFLLKRIEYSRIWDQ
ncbi:UNVERIFIED_CONTAM: Beta-glucosidase 12 [Sesamum latifolium]|uniref:Beta-glucosidase 12 n=1 Tax=Sesamum latifolium TaxID=2727402 RepID=A0AAW2TRF0_9LAMI